MFILGIWLFCSRFGNFPARSNGLGPGPKREEGSSGSGQKTLPFALRQLGSRGAEHRKVEAEGRLTKRSLGDGSREGQKGFHT